MPYRNLLIAFFAMTSAVSSPAYAQSPPTKPLSVTGGVALVSDYRFRGISLSDEDPAIQGTVNLNHSSGFYAGVWASSLEDTSVYGNAEFDLYGGWTGEVASDTAVDVGLLYYAYPNGEKAAGPSEYFEPYAKLSHTVGPVKGTLGAAYAWGQGAIGGKDNIYLFGDLNAGVPGTPLTLKAHAGRSEGSLATPLTATGRYWDWSLAAEAALGPVTLGLAYVDTDLPAARTVDAGIVFSLGLAF